MNNLNEETLNEMDLMERSIMAERNYKELSKYVGHRTKVMVRSMDRLLYFGKVELSTLRKLEEWPEDLEITPAAAPILKDVINELMGYNIKIGAKHGIGFMYAGECNPALINWINGQPNRVRDAYSDKIESVERDIYNFESYFAKNMSGRKKIYTEEEKKVIRVRLMERLKKRLARYEKKRDTFVGILSCGVTDIYQSLLPEEGDAYIVLFDGAYPSSRTIWTTDECNIRL